MKLRHWLAAPLFASGAFGSEFTNPFHNITRGTAVALNWDAVQPQQYPLYITAQVIEKHGDGLGVDAYRMNITTGANGTSYLWAGAPYPLRWIPGGLYRLELRPMSWTDGEVPLLAQSPFFNILDPDRVPGPAGSVSPQPTLADSESGTASVISKPLAIGLGVAIGVPSVVALVVVSWCFRKRQRKAATEKRRLERSKFVIT